MSRRCTFGPARCIGLIGAALATGVVLAHPDDVPHGEGLKPYTGPGFIDGLPEEAGTQFPSSGMMLRSWLTLGDMDGSATTGNDCWGYTAGARKYAIMGHSAGTTFVEITDPDSPDVVATLAGPTSTWRDIKTFGNHAYAVSEGGGGIQVFNLSLINSGFVTQNASVTSGGTTGTHNVAIDTTSGFLYRCGGGNNIGLRIYTLANPGAPVFVGQWNDRYVHDAQVVTFTSGPYAGRQIAYCCSGLGNGSIDTGFDIVDVTDKQNIQVLANISYPDNEYSHQGWLSPDRRYFYLGDELDEGDVVLNTRTIVINVEDIDNPFVVGEFINESTAIGHNLYTIGPWIFEANYRSGVRVFDATDPEAPVEAAYFDTYPANDSALFSGLWSVYPFFNDGTVIGSDIQRGLFVWTMPEMFLRFEFPSGIPGSIASSGAAIPVRITETAGVLAPGSAMLHYDNGAGFVSVAMTDLGGGDFEAVFPAAPCAGPIAFYFTAQTTDGATIAYPAGAPGAANSLLMAACDPNVAGDLDGDGDVDVDDLNFLLGLWQAVVPPGSGADLTGNGVVDVDDLNIVLGNWGAIAP